MVKMTFMRLHTCVGAYAAKHNSQQRRMTRPCRCVCTLCVTLRAMRYALSPFASIKRRAYHGYQESCIFKDLWGFFVAVNDARLIYGCCCCWLSLESVNFIENGICLLPYFLWSIYLASAPEMMPRLTECGEKAKCRKIMWCACIARWKISLTSFVCRRWCEQRTHHVMATCLKHQDMQNRDNGSSQPQTPKEIINNLKRLFSYLTCARMNMKINSKFYWRIC